MNGNGPLLTDAESLKAVRQMKINPISSLTAPYLVRALDNFEYGHLRDAALLFDVIAERDDTIKGVKPKREKEVSQLGWQIQPRQGVDKKSAEYLAQEDVLQKFWSSVRAVNAYDRNERGGFKRLVRQMMSAVSFRYAAHHIIWTPTRHGLKATFEHVPLWLFENTTGTLRYLKDPYATEGEVLKDGEWMTTYGDGLMIACSIGYFAKRNSYNDWLIFSERFSMPGILGRTSAKKGSPEGDAMKQAVVSYGHDFNAVLYGDDGAHAEPLQLIEANGNPGNQPMPAIIERVDRKFAALYRGADLSTMSSNDGEGTGASLQGEEKEILLKDDAEVISETLVDPSKTVLEWEFGVGVEILAELVVVTPASDDSAKVIDDACKLSDRGAKISINDVMRRSKLVAAEDDKDTLGAEKPSEKDEVKVDEANSLTSVSDEDEFLQMARAALHAARDVDNRSLSERLAESLEAENYDELRELLTQLNGELPDFIDETSAQEAVLERALMAAYLGDEGSEGEANAARKNPQFKGRDGRFAKNGSSMRGTSREGEDKGRKKDLFGRIPSGQNEYLSSRDNLARAKKAVRWAMKNEAKVEGVVYRKGLGKVDLNMGRPGVKKDDYRRGEGIPHIKVKHLRDVQHLASTLALGSVRPAYDKDGVVDPQKRELVHQGYKAIIKVKEGAKDAWVITHYYPKK